MFAGLPDPFTATRYHSLAVRRETLPADAGGHRLDRRRRDHGPARTRTRPIHGVQFHPESSPPRAATQLLANFLRPRRRQAPGRRPDGRARCPTPSSPCSARLADGATLTEDDAEAFFAACLRGEPTPAQVAAAVTAMRLRGETVGEITACARAMRRAAADAASTPTR